MGIAEMVERDCRVARHMADALAAIPGADVLNEVVLNQVMVRFDDDDAITRDVGARVQEDGTAWMGGTTYHGRVALRISVSNWATTEDDGDRTVAAMARCLADARAARASRRVSDRVTAIVLAAGAGSRFGGGKLLASLGGVPILQHVLDTLAAAGLEDVVVVLGRDRDGRRGGDPLAERTPGDEPGAGARTVQLPPGRDGRARCGLGRRAHRPRRPASRVRRHDPGAPGRPGRPGPTRRRAALRR